jgi:Kef-type K+ transport system membrane component KefB
MNTLHENVIVLSMLLVALAAGMAVWHTAFKDNLFQCVSLTGVCIFALGIAYYVYQCHQAPLNFSAFAISLAAYSLATIYKYWREIKNGTINFTR